MATPKKQLTADPSPAMVVSHTSSNQELNSKKSESNQDEKSLLSNPDEVQPPSLLNFLWHEVEKLVDLRLEKSDKPKLTNAIFIRVKDQIISLNLKEVLWVEAYGDYVNFFTEKTRYIVHSTMKAIESRLPGNEFARVHRSFIIRTDKIELIEESLIQIGKKLIPIGESYRGGFLSSLDIL